jgi:hypothetical protein
LFWGYNTITHIASCNRQYHIFLKGAQMLIFAIDPGFSGAWGAINHTGKYHTCGDMLNDGYSIDTESVWGEILTARDGQDCEVVIELVHSMPAQGVASSFKFGMAYGAAVALAQRFHSPCHMIRPQVWKKGMGLSSDKNESLDMARMLWPDAPLKLKKHDGRAEALLMAEYWRRHLFEL